MTSSVIWDAVQNADGVALCAPDTPNDAKQLLTQSGPTVGAQIGAGAFGAAYRSTQHQEYVVKEVFEGGPQDRPVRDFRESCGMGALRMNVALSCGSCVIDAVLSNGNRLVIPRYYCAYDGRVDGGRRVFRVVMSFEDGVPVYENDPTAGTAEERKSLLDALMVAGGAEPSLTGKYDDVPSAMETNLLKRLRPDGKYDVVLLDASSIARSSLSALLALLPEAEDQ